jgi:Arc/MetJ-type ribon-helix-helix transcriptional regulator
MSILLNLDLEHRIAAKVETGQYLSPAQVIEQGLDLLEARDAATQASKVSSEPPIWETIASLGQQVPEDEWARIPTDMAQNVDHYLYGSSKASE